MEFYKAIGAMLADLNSPMFGVMGDANLYMISAYRDNDGRYIRAVQETGALSMADGYHRATGRMAMAAVTHGPGLTNALTGLTEAVRARSEVLLLSGTTPLDPHHEQRLPVQQIAAISGAIYERVYTAETVGRDLSRSLQRVRGDRAPVLLDIPAHLMHEEVSTPQMVVPPTSAGHRPPNHAELDGALGLITSANRPVIVAGRGAVISGAREALVELAENTGALLAGSVLGKDLFLGNPRNIGIMGNLAHEEAQNALAQADCIVSFGAALNSMTTVDGDLTRGKKIVHVDVDPAAISLYTQVDEAVIGDARTIAEGMNTLLDEAGWESGPSSWIDRTVKALESRTVVIDDEHVSDDYVDVRLAAVALNEILPQGFAMVSDVGRYNAGTWPYLHVPQARDFFGMSAFGSIGLGLAGAIGASAGRPGVPVLALVGDGGLMMGVGELTTAVRERLPVITIVFNDDSYGYEHFRLKRYGFDPDYSKNDYADFAAVAAGLGMASRTIRSIEDIHACKSLWEGGLKGPLLLDVKIDPHHNLIA